MADKYDLYCPFDLEKHKQTFVNYLEVLIDEEGTIMYAVPSHQLKAVDLIGSRMGLTRKEVDMMCPQEYHCDYMKWLCIVAKVMFVWNDRCYAVNPTIKQVGALRRLKMAGVYTGSIPQAEEKEYPTCLRTLSPVEFERRLMGRWNLPKEGENHG